MTFSRFIGAFSVIVVAVGVASAQPPQTPTEICAAAPRDEPTTREFTQPEEVLEAGVDYRAVFCLETGAVYVDLYEQMTPITVNSFVFLSQNGYYNNTTFHRVLQDFMAQGGDPTGTGAGGPGYQFGDETLGFLTFDRPGLLAMANAGPGTNGSQFFITTAPTPWLNGAHTIFGEVLEGQENVVALPLRDPQANPTEPGPALDTVVIVTDPATVQTAAPEAPRTPATQDELAAALSSTVSADALPPDLVANQNAVLTQAELVATAPQALRADYDAFLTRHNFQFRAAVEIAQTGCNAEYGFDLLGYRLDAFASPEDASAALADGFLTTLAEARGFTPVEALANTLGSETSVTLCDQSPGALQQLTLQRGRYLATIYGAFNAEITAALPINELLGVRISPIFESALADAFRSEIR